MLGNQDAIAKRMVGMMEGRAQQFMKMMSELEGVMADKDEETRTTAEQQMTALAKVCGQAVQGKEVGGWR